MHKLTIRKGEWFDESRQEFISLDHDVILNLEHSLISLSRWESKWKKSFLSTEEKTREENLDYFRCMTLTTNVNPDIYYLIDPISFNQVNTYINDPMTATTFSDDKRGGKQIITSEIIYYWMTCYNIPFECEKWHLSRLLALIRVCATKNAPEKKMSAKEIMNRNRSLNKARRAQLHSKG